MREKARRINSRRNLPVALLRDKTEGTMGMLRRPSRFVLCRRHSAIQTGSAADDECFAQVGGRASHPKPNAHYQGLDKKQTGDPGGQQAVRPLMYSQVRNRLHLLRLAKKCLHCMRQIGNRLLDEAKQRPVHTVPGLSRRGGVAEFDRRYSHYL